MHKPVVMIIGAGLFQIPAIKEALEMGFDTLVVDRDAQAPGFQFATHKEYISTKDISRALACAEAYHARYGVRGVFTAGTDVSYTVASIAHALGLPGIAPEAALRATHKYRMRCALHEHGVPCPTFSQATTCAEALQRAHEIGYPVVIKPVDNMGARGVRRIDSDQELIDMFSESIKHSGSYDAQAVIVEAFMEGPEISMDTLVDEHGNVHLLTIADRHIGFPPYFVEWGHSIPSVLPQHVLDQAFAVMKQAIRAVGITRGAAKADIKITAEGAKIGEITARLSGGFHSQYTDPLATGMRSTKAALDIAIGNPLDRSDIMPRFHRVAIERALIPEPGRIVAIEGCEEARMIPGIYDIWMTKGIGDDVVSLTSNIGKAGHIIAHGKTREEAERAYKEARDMITIRTVRDACSMEGACT